MTDRVYFQISVRGETAVSDTLTDKVGDERINVYSAPVYHNGVLLDVLFDTYEMVWFQQNLEVSDFEGEGYPYVVRQNGDVVVLSTNKNSIVDMESLFASMVAADPSNLESADALREGMLSAASGYAEFANRERIIRHWASTTGIGCRWFRRASPMRKWRRSCADPICSSELC